MSCCTAHVHQVSVLVTLASLICGLRCVSELPVHHISPNMEEVQLTILNKTELLIVDTLEHEFHSTGDDSILMLLRLAQFITCGLILVTNVPMIIFIMNKSSKTFLDWMIVFDCLLCLSNLYPITLGLHYERKRNGATIHHYYDNHGFCFRVFLSFFFNLCNRQLTLGIVIYRFALVFGSSFWFPSHRKRILEKIIILTIFFRTLDSYWMERILQRTLQKLLRWSKKLDWAFNNVKPKDWYFVLI